MKFIKWFKLIGKITLIILPLIICMFLLNTEFVKEPPQKVDCFDSKGSTIIGQECVSQNYRWLFIFFLTMSILNVWLGMIWVIFNEIDK